MKPLTTVQLRRWLNDTHGTDFGVPDDVLAHFIDRAEAKRRVLGWGSVHVMVASMVREAYEGPKA